MGKYACKGPHQGARDFGICEECFQKQLKIDKLKEEVAFLKAQLRYRNKKDNQPYFGSATPSSKLKFKENSEEENKKKQGGAKTENDGGNRLFGVNAAGLKVKGQTHRSAPTGILPIP